MKKLITNIEPSKQVKATVVCIAALLLSTSWQVASARGTDTHAPKAGSSSGKPTTDSAIKASVPVPGGGKISVSE